MIAVFSRRRGADAEAVLAALDRSQAIIQFRMDGMIITANPNFLSAMGYTLAEVQGQNHRIFVDPAYANGSDYQQFWDRLRRGEFVATTFKRIGKGGREVWIEASYNPILGRDGKPLKVVKYATDVTRQTLELADMKGQVEAINRSQAVIQFGLDGTILDANDKFLTVLGYARQDVVGKHHSMFVDPAYAASPDYAAFWLGLNRGEYKTGQFKRLGKAGREVWIEASYNLILDLDGKPVKVVKFAADVTKRVEELSQLKQTIDDRFDEADAAIARTEAQAGMATESVQLTTGSVQTVAASAEQLASSVREIATMMSRSQTAAQTVTSQTEQAGEATRRLAETSNAMGGIVALIQDIAAQINLLALNATIEAARAGDAGRGFAVVAAEVKKLAQQAANATQRISAEIGQLQSVSDSVVAALREIDASIASVRDYVVNTASAIEEQSAVTDQMSSSMQDAARTTLAINDNMAEISLAVAHVNDALTGTREATKILMR